MIYKWETLCGSDYHALGIAALKRQPQTRLTKPHAGCHTMHAGHKDEHRLLPLALILNS